MHRHLLAEGTGANAENLEPPMCLAKRGLGLFHRSLRLHKNCLRIEHFLLWNRAVLEEVFLTVQVHLRFCQRGLGLGEPGFGLAEIRPGLACLSASYRRKQAWRLLAIAYRRKASERSIRKRELCV